MRVLKGALAIVVSMLLWVVMQILILLLVAAIAVGEGVLLRLLSAWITSDDFGYLFDVFIYGLPCLPSIYVASKITAGDARLTRWVQWITAVLMVVINIALYWGTNIMAAIGSAVCVAVVNYLFAKYKGA